MNNYIIQSPNSSAVFLGVVFDQDWANTDKIPNTLHYQLRPPAAPRSEQDNTFGGVADKV